MEKKKEGNRKEIKEKGVGVGGMGELETGEGGREWW